ncbi:MAG: type II toxin-antitoxin system RatA family toxin [Solirubrobacteraceae bacterium]
MTLLSGLSQIEIAAPIERCWALVQDVAGSPAWQRGLERVDVIERDGAGRVTLCDTITDARFTKVRCRVQVSYEPPHRVRFQRVASEDLDAMEASWELVEMPGGHTHATWRLAVDPGPVGLLARPLERVLRPLVVGQRAPELARAVVRAAPPS